MKEQVRHRTLFAVLLFALALFGIFVWPTPYQYELIHQGVSVRTGRIERWNPARVRFLSRYGCWVGDNETPYDCLPKERQNQINLERRAETDAQRHLSSSSSQYAVAIDYGILLVEQAGNKPVWTHIDREITKNNDFDLESKRAAREAAWNEIHHLPQPTPLSLIRVPARATP